MHTSSSGWPSCLYAYECCSIYHGLLPCDKDSADKLRCTFKLQHQLPYHSSKNAAKPGQGFCLRLDVQFHHARSAELIACREEAALTVQRHDPQTAFSCRECHFLQQVSTIVTAVDVLALTSCSAAVYMVQSDLFASWAPCDHGGHTCCNVLYGVSPIMDVKTRGWNIPLRYTCTVV